jgi:hypothetical protein
MSLDFPFVKLSGVHYGSKVPVVTVTVFKYRNKTNEKGLETSKNLLSRIHNRDLYKCVYESPPEMVFIYICYFKIDGTEMPTTSIGKFLISRHVFPCFAHFYSFSANLKNLFMSLDKTNN